MNGALVGVDCQLVHHVERMERTWLCVQLRPGVNFPSTCAHHPPALATDDTLLVTSMLEDRKVVVVAPCHGPEAELNGRMMLDLELKSADSCSLLWMELQLLGLNLWVLHVHHRGVLLEI
jgi:hypothetical protein